MPPSLTNGKICYLEIPATDVARSADFYRQSFGWEVRTRGDGRIAFDDRARAVRGTWVLGRKPASEPGLLMYIMVDSIAEALELIVAHGGAIVQSIGGDAPEITARI